MLKPTLFLSVDKNKTWEMVQMSNGAGYLVADWPRDREAFDALIATIDGHEIDLTHVLRSKSSTEDGFIPLKPSSHMILSVTVMIDAIYKEDRIGMKTLSKWNIEVIAVDLTDGPVDYSSKSKMSVRLNFNISPKGSRYTEKYEFTVMDYITAYGAWMGYLTIAGAALAWWFEKTAPFGT